MDTTENHNLYVKISVPTTSGGEVDEGMAIAITLWPTADYASAIDGTISPATFEEGCVDDYWDERDTINVKLSARRDALTLDGFNGAYLSGTEIYK